MLRFVAALTIALIVPAFAETTAQTTPDSWVTLTDPAGVFSIAFPASPRFSNDTTPASDNTLIPVFIYSVSDNMTANIVMVADFSGLEVDPDRSLAQAVAALQTGDRTVVSSVADVLDGHKGQALTLLERNGDRITDRIFFVDNRVYQIMTLVNKDVSAAQIATAVRFSQSLHFLQ